MLTIQRPDGTLCVVDAAGFFIRDTSGQIKGLVGIFRDLTEQRRAEAKRAALQEQIIARQPAALRELPMHCYKQPGPCACSVPR